MPNSYIITKNVVSNQSKCINFNIGNAMESRHKLQKH